MTTRSKARSILPLVLLALCGCAAQRAGARRAIRYSALYFKGPAPEGECRDGGRFKYCVYRPPRGAADDPDATLYFLHFGSGSEKTFGGPIGRAFYAGYAKRRATPPRVVSVSFAPYWILVDKPGGRYPAPTFREFVEDWMPELERGAPPRRRLLWGISQGGFSAALLALRRPELWDAAALSCPAIPPLSPFAPVRELDDYAARHGLDARRFAYGLTLFTYRLENDADYRALDVVRLAAAAKGPRMFLQANEKDEFGFFDGASRLRDALASGGTPTRFQAQPGGHCVNDVDAVVDFLSMSPALSPRAGR